MNIIGFFLTGLLLLFLGLRISNVIEWSYWIVLMPGYIPAGIWFVVQYIETAKEMVEEERRKEYLAKHPEKKSKFMQKLDEAMVERDKLKKVKEN